jgi:hypothetical protein
VHVDNFSFQIQYFRVFSGFGAFISETGESTAPFLIHIYIVHLVKSGMIVLMYK